MVDAEKKNKHFSIPLFCLAVGIILLTNLLLDPVIDLQKPQSPGLWPIAMVSGLLLVGFCMLCTAIRTQLREKHNLLAQNNNKQIDHIGVKQKFDFSQQDSDESDHDDRKLFLGIVGIIAYGFTVHYLGFTLATVGIIGYWLFIWNIKSFLKIISTSFVGTGLILVVFVKIGYLPLPKGVGQFHDFTIWLFRTLSLFQQS